MSRLFLRRAFITGLIVAVAVIHLSLVGLLESMDGLDIVTKLMTVGSLLPGLLALIAGYRAGGRMRVGEMVRPRPGVALASGALAGLTVGVVVALFTIFVDLVQPRGMLIHASPKLVAILLWQQDLWVGTILTTAAATAIGAFGALLQILPRSPKRGVLTAIVAVFVMVLMQTFVTQVLIGLPLKGLNSFLYAHQGFTVPGAVTSAVVFGVGGYLWAERGHQARGWYSGMAPAARRTTSWTALFVGVAVLLLLPSFIGPFLSQTLDTIGIYILLGLGLNIVVGFAGLLDLGYVAFYAVGAYALAVLTSPVSPALNPALNFWLAVPLVMGITAIIGISIGAPVLRLRGDYLAIVTLGFGEIARIIFLSNAMTPILGGAQGILQIPPPKVLGLSLNQPQTLYYPILIACVLAALVAISLANSRVGRAWTAMREDESVAEATGINTTKYKLMAFAMGATFGGLGGAFYAANIGSVFPQQLNLQVSINVLALIILGGVGSIPGVIVGAVVLVGLPELLRQFSEYRLLIYGAVLVAMMLIRPEGLLPNRSRRAELHGGEIEGPGEQEGAEPAQGPGSAEPLIT